MRRRHQRYHEAIPMGSQALCTSENSGVRVNIPRTGKLASLIHNKLSSVEQLYHGLNEQLVTLSASGNEWHLTVGALAVCSCFSPS
jgi:hypothetical protein